FVNQSGPFTGATVEATSDSRNSFSPRMGQETTLSSRPPLRLWASDSNRRQAVILMKDSSRPHDFNSFSRWWRPNWRSFLLTCTFENATYEAPENCGKEPLRRSTHYRKETIFSGQPFGPLRKARAKWSSRPERLDNIVNQGAVIPVS